MKNNEWLKNLKRKADQIVSDEDITTTDDIYLDLARKIFVHHYGGKYRELDLSLYQTGSFKHSYDPKKMVTPHFVRDDGTIIYLQLVQNGIYLKQIYEDTIDLSMEILKLKKASLFTIFLHPTFKISGSAIPNKEISKCFQKITEKKFTFVPQQKEYLKTSETKRRKISRNLAPKNTTSDTAHGFIKDDWVSASKTRNYSLNDTLIDWLDEWYDQSDSKNLLESDGLVEKKTGHPNDEYSFSSFLKSKGRQFETKLADIFREKFGKKFVTICENMYNYKNCILEYEKRTIGEIMKGTPIIYQGIVMNRSGPLVYSYGIPDLLVRSDYLDKIVELKPYDDQMKSLKAPNLKGNYHYVVVDIKWTTLELCVDGIRLRNSGSMPAYKSQLYIYNHALGKIQGYEPKTSFILGRRYKYESKGTVYSENNCFARFGHIQYDGWDQNYIKEAIEAINWIKNLRANGKKWTLLPKPSVPELYPNMSSITESHWDKLKIHYAKKIGEITVLWNCGPKNRKIAHQNGVYSYWDDNCTAETVGVLGPKKGPTLDQIISINKKRKFEDPLDRLVVNINKDVDNRWMDSYKLRITVDFETINCLFGDFKELPICQDTNYLYMIGVAYQVYGQKPRYQMFLASELTKDAEFQMIHQFYQFLRKLTDKHIGTDYSIPSLYHWGHIERTFFSGLCDRLHNNIGDDITNDIETMKTELEWYDMCECFKNNPIVINGCFSFGLKEIASRLADLGLIQTVWSQDSACSNGNTAMIMAYKSYETCKQKDISINQCPIMKEIRNYNKIDCVVIHEIVDLLRKKIGLDRLNGEPVSKKRRLN